MPSTLFERWGVAVDTDDAVQLASALAALGAVQAVIERYGSRESEIQGVLGALASTDTPLPWHFPPEWAAPFNFGIGNRASEIASFWQQSISQASGGRLAVSLDLLTLDEHGEADLDHLLTTVTWTAPGSYVDKQQVPPAKVSSVFVRSIGLWRGGWRWPVQVGTTDSWRGRLLRRRLQSASILARGLAVLVLPDINADVVDLMLVEGADSETVERGLAGRAIISLSRFGGLLDVIPLALRRPRSGLVAAVEVPSDYQTSWLNALLAQVAHDTPLDEAIWRADAELRNWLGLDAGDLPPPLIVANPEFLDNVRLSKEVDRVDLRFWFNSGQRMSWWEQARQAAVGEPGLRYADVTVHDLQDGDRLLEDSERVVLRRTYRLVVAVRGTRHGVGHRGAQIQPIVVPPSDQDIRLIVAISELEEGTFRFGGEGQVQELVLPPSGDSPPKGAALFEFEPLRASANDGDVRSIEIRIFYRNHMVEYLRLDLLVGRGKTGPSAPAWPSGLFLSQHQIERGYDRLLQELEPRQLHIHVSLRDGLYHLAFTKASVGIDHDNDLRLHSTTDIRQGDLSRRLRRIRAIWYDIAIIRYQQALDGDPGALEGSLRELAEQGDQLWSLLFRQRRAGALWHIGRWLKENPLPDGSLVQVTIAPGAADFVFPWSLLFDGDIADDERETVDPTRFWGLRYVVEVVPGERRAKTDRPIELPPDGLNLAFMLWQEFPNADEQLQLMQQLHELSAGQINGAIPAIVAPLRFWQLAKNCEAHLLYFYTHGYGWSEEAQAGHDGAKLFLDRYKRLPKKSPLREQLRPYVELVREAEDSPDSWIRLSRGKLELARLRRSDIFLRFNPIVFLNMCQSAQVAPNLSDSLVKFFLDQGAVSVLGTECPVTTAFAHPFSEQLLKRLFQGEALGAALVGARCSLLDQHRNPLGLAYTLYGSATTRFTPPPLPTTVQSPDHLAQRNEHCNGTESASR